MTEEERYQLVLEAINNASPEIREVTSDLKSLVELQEKYLKNSKEFLNTGHFIQPRVPTGRGDETRFGSYADLNFDPQKLLQSLKTVQREQEQIRAQERRDDEANQRIITAARKREEDERRKEAKDTAAITERIVKDEAAAETKARSDARHQQSKDQAEALRARKAQNAEETADIRNMIRQQKQAFRDLEESRRNAEKARENVAGGLGQAGTGLSQIAMGGGQIAGASLRMLRTLGRAGEVALDAGRGVLDAALGVLKDIERTAAVAGLSMGALGTVVAHTGLEFDALKQNSMIALEQMTGSAKRAGDVFHHAFNVAIPAKMEFKEVLEGFRTMEAFGLRVDHQWRNTKHTIGELAVTLAQGMNKPLEQVTRVLGSLSQGRALRQQLTPLGLGQENLARFGAQFDKHGSPVDRRHLVDVAMDAIESRWGNLLDKMKNTFEARLDSMISFGRIFAGKLTDGMFGSFTRAFGTVSDLLQGMIGGKFANLTDFLKTPFDLMGRAVEAAANQLPKLLRWMDSIVSRKALVNFIAEVVTLIWKMADDVGAVVNKMSGGKGLVGVWETFKQIASQAVHEVLRAWGFLTGAIDYTISNGPKLWKMLIDGAKELKGLLEVIVGLMAASFGAQVVGGVTRIAGGLGNLNGGLTKLVQGLAGGGLGAGAATAAGDAAATAGAVGAGAAGGGGFFAALAACTSQLGVLGTAALAAAVAFAGFKIGEFGSNYTTKPVARMIDKDFEDLQKSRFGSAAAADMADSRAERNKIPWSQRPQVQAQIHQMMAQQGISYHAAITQLRANDAGAVQRQKYDTRSFDMSTAHAVQGSDGVWKLVDGSGRTQDGSAVPTGGMSAFSGYHSVNGPNFHLDSTHFGGTLGWIQDAGKWTIGAVGGGLNAAIPAGAKDFLSGAIKAGQSGAAAMDAYLGGSGPDDYAARKSAVLDFLNGHPEGAKAKPKPPVIAPGSYLSDRYGGGGSAEQDAPNAAVLGQMIEAYKTQIGGMDRDVQSRAKLGLVPMLSQKAMADQSEVQQALKEAQTATKETSGEAKDSEDMKQDALAYWKAVEVLWKDQEEIAAIQRDAMKEAYDNLREANEAQEEAVKSQIDMLPESQQHVAMLSQMTPLLRDRQQMILDQMKTVEQGSKEFFKLQAEFYHVEKQIVENQNKAVDEEAKSAFDTPKKQSDVIRKLIGFLPKPYQGRAAQALILPKIKQMMEGADMERDPEKRQEKYLEVLGEIGNFKEFRKQSDWDHGFFGHVDNAQREAAIRDWHNRNLVPNRHHGMSNEDREFPGLTRGQRRMGREADARAAFQAMTPFAPQQHNGMGDRFMQIVLPLMKNPSDDQVADVIRNVLNDELYRSMGR